MRDTETALKRQSAYDAINLLAEVIRKGGTDRKAIRDTLALTKDFPGVCGNITFNEYGCIIGGYVLLQVKNGEFVLYSEK
ncbi:hypothetical protein QUF72_00285 [Desulfobacterales bacterium HSG2]|nr:hypothetical protein [Desulfobacterales bacterium HSG2]